MAETDRTRSREQEPEPKTYYDGVLRRMAEARERQKTAHVFVGGDEREYEVNRQGRLKYYFDSERFPNPALDSWAMFIHDVRDHSGIHKHQGGIVLYVLDGEGTTRVENTVVNWKKGDLLAAGQAGRNHSWPRQPRSQPRLPLDRLRSLRSAPWRRRHQSSLQYGR